MIRRTPIRSKRKKPRRREGRLYGQERSEVREQVFARSAICEMRAFLIDQINDQVNSGEISYMHGQDMARTVLLGCTRKPTQWAHIKSTGASGADTPENTLASCAHCHDLHHRAIKPVQRKP